MKHIPMPYKPAMVQAKLARRKTQTRRLPNATNIICNTAKFGQLDFSKVVVNGKGSGYEYMKVYRPEDDTWHRVFYKAEPGDVLWVRECFTYNGFYYIYKADHPGMPLKWKPSIHMPKKACRMWDKVLSIRVERVQDISEDDAIAEGVDNWTWKNMATPQNWLDYTDPQGPPLFSAYDSFMSLWDSINGAESLKANPWLFVIDFEPCDMPKDFLIKHSPHINAVGDFHGFM